eukprot:TRINITY_DN3782_c0_g1_i5.p1 TRINITY_DN3782_c0_g1~~TRINITY_DN3782_c0_g1_i5.p1  ORF type:complete len:350 (-),score=31.48 TRINITY_DN3782_c0_g1_i5:432-1415(-)
MAAPFAESLHWVVCLLALSMGSVLTLLSLAAIRSRYRAHDTLLLFLLVLAPDVVLYLNYIPFFSAALINEGIPTGAACTLSGFFIVSSICATNLGICFQSYAIYARVAHQKRITLTHIALYGGVSWSIGFGVAILYLIQFEMGPYKGLYCCVAGHYSWENSLPIFIFFLLSMGSIVIFYGKLFLHARETALVIKNTSKKDEILWGIVKRGLVVLCGYYVAWFGVTLNSLQELTGSSYPLWRDIAASWCIKSGALFDAIMCLITFWKLQATEEGTSVHTSLNDESTVSRPKGVRGSVMMSEDDTLIRVQNRRSQNSVVSPLVHPAPLH